MTITFLIDESLEQLYNNCLDFEGAEVEHLHGVTLIHLRDSDYPESCAEVTMLREAGSPHGQICTVTIRTAWSAYDYHFENSIDGVYCTYRGAYAGLCQQNLLPKFTPLLNGYELIESTTGTYRLADYIEFQNKRRSALQAVEIVRGRIHPVLIQKRFPGLAQDIEVQWINRDHRQHDDILVKSGAHGRMFLAWVALSDITAGCFQIDAAGADLFKGQPYLSYFDGEIKFERYPEWYLSDAVKNRPGYGLVLFHVIKGNFLASAQDVRITF
jgi:hypothetical protein